MAVVETAQFAKPLPSGFGSDHGRGPSLPAGRDAVFYQEPLPVRVFIAI